MGGPGSTRWLCHSKKIQVEECHQLSIFALKPFLKTQKKGTINWLAGDRILFSAKFRIILEANPMSINLQYKIRAKSEESIGVNYSVPLTTTPLPRGGKRYWFICPFVGCRRRIGILYLPFYGKYFGCRYCYDLTYKSSQEQHAYDSVYRMIAISLKDIYPAITKQSIKSVLDKR